jgi:hypothetical protein
MTHPAYAIVVTLTDNDARMVRAFAEWHRRSPATNPTRTQIEYGCAAGNRFPAYRERHGATAVPGRPLRPDMTGPRTFARALVIGSIERTPGNTYRLSKQGWQLAELIESRKK